MLEVHLLTLSVYEYTNYIHHHILIISISTITNIVL